eukprot:TRINITY_DN7221_c0_g1_i1.p5 TRINITY_DN7221_c0_g1~~TRINITY_DN7221_c0_g1_i1.p5  ORF type:complete len:63 (+),score=9.46 TRINITY_DN7221_c0_g1_i1:277-465(+)
MSMSLAAPTSTVTPLSFRISRVCHEGESERTFICSSAAFCSLEASRPESAGRSSETAKAHRG